MPFRSAHGIAARLVSRAGRPSNAPLADVLREVSREVLGTSIEMEDEALARVLSPRHFVEVRRTLGGPAPDETARALQASLELFDRDQAWVGRIRDGLATADTRLRDRSQAL